MKAMRASHLCRCVGCVGHPGSTSVANAQEPESTKPAKKGGSALDKSPSFKNLRRRDSALRVGRIHRPRPECCDKQLPDT
jgi:hypothetical protein